LKNKIFLLFVGNNEELTNEINDALKNSDFDFFIKSVEDISSFKKAIDNRDYDVVLFDIDSSIPYRKFLLISRDLIGNVPFVAVLQKVNYIVIRNILKDGFDGYCFKDDITYLGLVLYKELCYFEKKQGQDYLKRELEREMERLEVTIESIGDGVITTDQDGNIIMINKAAIDIIGWTAREAIGKPLDAIFNIFDKITGERAESPYERVMAKECSLGLKKNTVLLSKEGKEMYVSASSAPIKDVGGTIIGVVVVFRDITRIIKNENELRKLSMVVEHSPSLVLVADPEKRVEYANPKFREVLGYTLDEIKQKGFDSFLNKEKNIDIEDLTGDKEWHGEIKLKKKNGEITWQLASICAIRNTEGIVTNWLGTSEDITKRKQYENKLANEQRNLQTIFDTAPVGMLIVDRKRHIRKANMSLGSIIHKGLDEIVGKRIGEAICCKNFIVNDDECGMSAECHQCKFQKGIYSVINNKNEIERHEFCYNSWGQNKESMWLSISAVAATIDEEECAIVAIEDITSKKTVEAALTWSRYFYINLFEEFPAPIWRSGKDGVINYFNKTWLRFTGREMEEELNGGWIENMHPKDVERFKEVYNKALKEHKPYEIEFRLKRADGEYRWIINDGRPFSNLEDDFAGFIGVCTDVTEKIQVTENLILAKEAAETASRSKSEFLANMSHEIRTPLNGIIGMTNLTLQSNLTEDQKENLSIANSCADLLLSVINDILDYSKIEAGKMTIDEIRFDLYKLLDETFKSHLFKVRQKGIEYKYQIGDGIPRFVFGDPIRLQQVLNNLISNAVKFTDLGEVKICSNVIRQYDKKLLMKFTVSDTGIGIGEDEMQRLFKSFSQVDGSITRKYGGTGLGLVISKQLVEMMNGEISVESEKNKGSVFSFTVLLATEKINNHEESIEDVSKFQALQKSDTVIASKIACMENNDVDIEEVLYEEDENDFAKYINKLNSAIETKNMELIEKMAALIKNNAGNDRAKSLAFKIQLTARKKNMDKLQIYYTELCEEIKKQ